MAIGESSMTPSAQEAAVHPHQSVARRNEQQRWMRMGGLGFLLAVACVVLALQTVPRDHFNGSGPVVILDETEASEGDSKLNVQELKREIKELEKQEMSHAQARQKALEDAVEKTSSLNCTESDDACKHAAKAIRWKASKDQYEQAALKDIMKEWKKEHNVTTEGLKEFHQIQLKASQLSGIKELNSLQKSAAKKEMERNVAQQATLKALKDETKQLNAIKLKEQQARQREEAREQARANAKLRDEKRVDLHAMSYNPTDRARNDAQALRGVKREQDAFRKQEQHSTSASEEAQAVAVAKSEDDAREKAFHEELEAMRKADASALKQHQHLLSSLAKESKAMTAKKERGLDVDEGAAGGREEGGGREEEAGHTADVRQAEQEEARRQAALEGERGASLERHAAAAAKRQAAASKEAQAALHEAAAAEGFEGARGKKAAGERVGGGGLEGGFGHAGEYHRDVAAAEAVDAAREAEAEKAERAERTAEEAAAAQRQSRATAEADKALEAENAAAGYGQSALREEVKLAMGSPGGGSSADSELRRVEAEEQGPRQQAGAGAGSRGSGRAEEGVEGAGSQGQLAVTDRVIASRDAEIDQIFGKD